MTDYIETQTKDGKTLLIEVEFGAKGTTGFGRQSEEDKTAQEAARAAYAQALDTIRACANDVVDTLQELSTQPSAASIEFGIKFDKAGAMIAKSTGAGQFKVSLSWKQPEPNAEK